MLGPVLAFASPQRRRPIIFRVVPCDAVTVVVQSFTIGAVGLTAGPTDKHEQQSGGATRRARPRHQGLSDAPYARTIGTSPCKLKASVGSRTARRVTIGGQYHSQVRAQIREVFRCTWNVVRGS